MQRVGLSRLAAVRALHTSVALLRILKQPKLSPLKKNNDNRDNFDNWDADESAQKKQLPPLDFKKDSSDFSKIKKLSRDEDSLPKQRKQSVQKEKSPGPYDDEPVLLAPDEELDPQVKELNLDEFKYEKVEKLTNNNSGVPQVSTAGMSARHVQSLRIALAIEEGRKKYGQPEDERAKRKVLSTTGIGKYGGSLARQFIQATVNDDYTTCRLMLKSTIRFRPLELTNVDLDAVLKFSHFVWENDRQRYHNIIYYMSYFWKANIQQNNYHHQYISLLYPKFNIPVLELGAWNPAEAISAHIEYFQKIQDGKERTLPRMRIPSTEYPVRRIGQAYSNVRYPWMTEIIDEIKNTKPYIRPNQYEPLLYFLCRTTAYDSVKALNDYRTSRGFPLSPHLYIELLEFFHRHDQVGELLKLAKEAVTAGFLAHEDFWYTYERARNFSVKYKQHEEGLKLCHDLRVQTNEKIVVSPISKTTGECVAVQNPLQRFAYILSAEISLRNGETKKAMEYIRTLQTLNFKPSVGLVNMLLSTTLSMPDPIQNFESALEFLESQQITVDTNSDIVTYNIFLKKHILADNFPNAIQLYKTLCDRHIAYKQESNETYQPPEKIVKFKHDKRMPLPAPKRGPVIVPKIKPIQPDIYTLSIILQGYIKTGDVEGAKEAWGKALDADVVPGLHCYTNMMRVFVKAGLYHSAVELFKKIRAQGVLPDIDLYNIAMWAAIKMDVRKVSVSESDGNVEVGDEGDGNEESEFEGLFKLPRSTEFESRHRIEPLSVQSRQRVKLAHYLMSDLQSHGIKNAGAINFTLFDVLSDVGDLETARWFLEYFYPVGESASVPAYIFKKVEMMCTRDPKVAVEVYKKYGMYRISSVHSLFLSLCKWKSSWSKENAEEVKWVVDTVNETIAEFTKFGGVKFQKSADESEKLGTGQLDIPTAGLAIRLLINHDSVEQVQRMETFAWETISNAVDKLQLSQVDDTPRELVVDRFDNKFDGMVDDEIVVRYKPKDSKESDAKAKDLVMVREIVQLVQAVMNGYAKLGLPKECLKASYHAEEYLREKFKIKKELPKDEIVRLVSGITELDTGTRNIVFDAYARTISKTSDEISDTEKQSNYETAMKIFEDSVKLGLIDEALLSMYIDLNNFENLDSAISRVRQLVAESKTKIVSKVAPVSDDTPNAKERLPTNVYNSIIEGYARTERWSEIPKVLYEMMQGGVPILDKTINAVLIGPESEAKNKCVAFIKVVAGVDGEVVN